MRNSIEKKAILSKKGLKSVEKLVRFADMRRPSSDSLLTEFFKKLVLQIFSA